MVYNPYIISQDEQVGISPQLLLNIGEYLMRNLLTEEITTVSGGCPIDLRGSRLSNEEITDLCSELGRQIYGTLPSGSHTSVEGVEGFRAWGGRLTRPRRQPL